MEKSVRDREEKRGLQDFKSMESLKSRFEDIGFAFKSWSRESSRSDIFGGGGKLKNASFDKKCESWSTEIDERESSMIQIDERESPKSQIDEEEEEASDESWRKKIFREIVLGSGNLESFWNEIQKKSPDESQSYWSEMLKWWNSEIRECESPSHGNCWNKMLERWRSDIGECETPPPESCKSEIDEEASQEESWIQESWNKIGERSGSEIDKRESWKSEIDGDIDKCESWKSQIDGEDSDNERLYHTFGRWLDRVQVDSEEDSDKEGLYQSFGCWVDADEEIPAGMPKVTWRSDLYNDNDPVNYKKMGRVFEHWRFRVIWGRDGCYPSSGEKMRLVYSCPSKRQEMALIYLKWIAKVLGSKQQALDSLVSFTDTYFICQGISFDRAHLFKRFVNIYCVYPVIYERDVQGYDTEETLFSFTNEKEKVFCRCKLNEEWPKDPSAISPRYNKYWRGYPHM